jgi:Transposase DDE domain
MRAAPWWSAKRCAASRFRSSMGCRTHDERRPWTTGCRSAVLPACRWTREFRTTRPSGGSGRSWRCGGGVRRQSLWLAGMARQARAAGIKDGLMYKAGGNKPLETWQKWFNKAVAPIRAAVERTFATMKRWYGYERGPLPGAEAQRLPAPPVHGDQSAPRACPRRLRGAGEESVRKAKRRRKN